MAFGIYVCQQFQPGGCQASTSVLMCYLRREKRWKTPQSLSRPWQRNWLGEETRSSERISELGWGGEKRFEVPMGEFFW
ncbi:hypothetical protein TNCV_1607471 [Trichonephila clavipes]|nr:hypothetical protein TNCV_1607471 [Trichonephila clavipes]